MATRYRQTRLRIIGNKDAEVFSLYVQPGDPDYPCKLRGDYTMAQIEHMLDTKPYRCLLAYGKQSSTKHVDTGPKPLTRTGTAMCDENVLVDGNITFVKFVSDSEAYLYVPPETNLQVIVRKYYNWLIDHGKPARAEMLKAMYKYQGKHQALRICYKNDECAAISYKNCPI